MNSNNNITNTTNTSNTKELCWKDVIASPEILKEFPVAIEKFRHGDYSACDLDLKKRIGDICVYGIRVNNKIRLLFTTIAIIVDKKKVPYAYILEVLRDHNYKVCKSFKPGWVKSFLPSQKVKEHVAYYFAQQELRHISSEITQIKSEPQEESVYQVEYLDLHFFNNKWFQLNREQELLLSYPMPFMCRGPAGTGKSIMTMAIIAKAVAEIKYRLEKEKDIERIKSIEQGCKIIYITQAERLKSDIHEQWQASPYADELAEKIVRFVTYEELLLEAYPHKKIVDDEFCKKWLQNYINVFKKITPKHELTEDFYGEAVYAECRIISGYVCAVTGNEQDEKEYLSLGVRHTLFSERIEERKLAWKAYHALCAHLQHEKLMHAAFTLLPEKKYYLILVDEAQDFSLLQNASVYKKAKNKNAGIFYHSNQSLYDKISKQEYLKALLEKQNKNQKQKKITPYELIYSYRSKPKVARVINHVVDLGIFLDGGSSDERAKLINFNQGAGQGSVEWPLFNEGLLEKLAERAQSKKCAVVTHDEFKAEAIKIFKTYMVYSVEEIKGSEFDEIIAYKIFSSAKYSKAVKEINQRLATRQRGMVNSQNRSPIRATKGDTFSNILYVVTSRAISSLTFAEESDFKKRPEIRHIVSYMFEDGRVTSDYVIKEKVEVTTASEWLEFAGNDKRVTDEQANSIRKAYGKTQINNVAPKKNASSTTKMQTVMKHQHSVATVSLSKTEKSASGFPIEISQLTPSSVAKYLNGVQANVTEEKLIKLFSNKNALAFLFGFNVYQKDSSVIQTLFSIITNNDDYRKLLYQALCMKNNENMPWVLKLFQNVLSDQVVLKIHTKPGNAREVKSHELLQGMMKVALRCDEHEFIQLMWHSKKIDFSRISDGYTAMQMAANYNNIMLLNLLLGSKEFDVDGVGVVTQFGTPLYIAAKMGNYEVVKLLCAAGAKVDGDNTMLFPLDAAIESGHSDISDYLISKGATCLKDKLAKSGVSSFKHFPIVCKENIDSGNISVYLNHILENFDKNKLDELFNQDLVLKYLFGISFKRVLTTQRANCFFDHLVEDAEKAKLFYQYLCSFDDKGSFRLFKLFPGDFEQAVLQIPGVDNEMCDVRAESLAIRIIVSAIILGHNFLIQALLAIKKFDLQAVRYCDYTLLQLAIVSGNLSVVRMLLSDDKINLENAGKKEPYKTPLYFAVLNGHLDITKELVNAGANIHGSDAYPAYTPLRTASENNHVLIVSYLKEKSAKPFFVSGNVKIKSVTPDKNVLSVSKIQNKNTVNDNTLNTFPIEYKVNVIGERTLEYLRKLLNGFDRDKLIVMVKHPLAMKFLFGVKFTLLSDFELGVFNNINKCAVYEQEPKYLYEYMFEKHTKLFFDLMCEKDAEGQPWLYKLFPSSARRGPLLKMQYSDGSCVIKMPSDLMQILVHEAVITKHLDFVQMLWNSNMFSFTGISSRGETALQYAVKHRCLMLLELLLDGEMYEDIDDVGTRNGYVTPLYLAAEAGEIDMVKALVKAGANINGCDQGFAGSPVSAAYRAGHHNIVSYLAASGAMCPPLNDKTEWEVWPSDGLDVSCFNNDDEVDKEEVNKLVNDIMSNEANRRHLIEISADAPSSEIVKYLNSVLNKFSEGMLIKLFRHKNALPFLFGFGFSAISRTGQEDRRFKTLIDRIIANPVYAKTFFATLCLKDSEGMPWILKLFHNVKPMDVVLKLNFTNGSDMEIIAVFLFKKIMDAAVARDESSFIKLIWDSKFYLGHLVLQEDSLLTYAVNNNSLTLLNLILASKQFASIDEVGSGRLYETPLYLAAKNGYLEIVKALIDAGAKVDGNDKKLLNTPLQVAYENDHNDVAVFLQEKGAKLFSPPDFDQMVTDEVVERKFGCK